ncbi:hypothetical protein [Methyloligella solikamskensis]|uniref:Uncharacterized protein n=1 Tax=Methyloligella solikamskensis TaxID=1177756 RepID=A0ABW3JC46_9HYPH
MTNENSVFKEKNIFPELAKLEKTRRKLETIHPRTSHPWMSRDERVAYDEIELLLDDVEELIAARRRDFPEHFKVFEGMRIENRGIPVRPEEGRRLLTLVKTEDHHDKQGQKDR